MSCRILNRLAQVLLAVVLVQKSVASASTQPTLDERLARIVNQIDKQRKAMHVPGCSIAIVKDGEAVMLRGFGKRDLENDLAVTEETLFAIGSTTKAMTATLIGMLVDDGKMNWDDHPRKYLPEFRIKDATADEKVTIRDLLCHRIGYASNDLLWYAGGSTRSEILKTVAEAELLHPFRENFQYNNVMFLAAGEAAGRAASSDWDSLMAQRIFSPLGMTSSDTSINVAKTSSHLSKGYEWDKDKSLHIHKPMRRLDNIAPAGSVNSCAKDMAEWVRFLLNKGKVGDKQLISIEQLEHTWTKQMAFSGDAHYALGWVTRKLNGRRLLEHSGGIDGFGAYVALLPDEGIGFALLTNVTASGLQSMSVNIVIDGLLGELRDDDESIDLAEAQDFLGKYRFEAMGVDLTVLIQNGNLAVDVPGQIIYELKPPDADGRRLFASTDQISVSFVRDESNQVNSMKLFQSGLEFELPREGVEQPIEITAGDAHKYLGTYRSEQMQADLKVLHRNGRLAIDVPKQMVYDLHLPDDQDRWAFRAKKDIQVKFLADDSGEVASLVMYQNGQEMVMPRIQASAASSMPTVDEVLSLHTKAHGSSNIGNIKSLRITGTIRFVHQGATGAITVHSEGLDRFSQTLDLGKFGSISIALNGDKAWSASSFADSMEMKDDQYEQTRLQHPLVISANWGELVDRIDVERVDTLNDRKVYVLKLTVGSNASCLSFIDAESGRVVRDELTIRHPSGGPAKSVITYDEYREVEGVQLPVRYAVTSDGSGKMIVEIHDIKANQPLPPDAFTPPSSLN